MRISIRVEELVWRLKRVCALAAAQEAQDIDDGLLDPGVGLGKLGAVACSPNKSSRSNYWSAVVC